MHIRKLSAVAAALVPLGLAAHVGAASADTAPAASASPSTGSPTFTFIPPRVGPLQVSLGPTIIDGQQISPGVNVSTPGTSLPPISWTPPS